MIKAVLLDYTGTMVREDDPWTMKLLKIFLENSDLKDPREALGAVWGLVKKSEWEDYQDSYIGKDEMVERILSHCRDEYNLRADLKEMHDIWRNIWIHAPLFEDVLPFLEACPLPVYVVTNDDLKYVEESLRAKGVKVAGIVSAESVKACKPHREIMDEALRVAGVLPEEAVLIGDSETSDVACAIEVGICPILLDRSGKKNRSDVRVIHSLRELTI